MECKLTFILCDELEKQDRDREINNNKNRQKSTKIDKNRQKSTGETEQKEK
jgi:hypothetical protein